jgi:hypothetical protein
MPEETTNEQIEGLRGLTFEELKKVSERLEDLKGRSEEFDYISDPEQAYKKLKKTAGENNYDLEPHAEDLKKLVKQGNLEGLIKLGKMILNYPFRQDIVDYNSSYKDKSGAVLKGAPKEVLEYIADNANESSIEKHVKDYPTAGLHLKIKKREAVIKSSRQDTEEGENARDAITQEFESKYISRFKGMEDLFREITRALGSDLREYSTKTKELSDSLVPKLGTSDRAYASSVMGTDLRGIVEAEFGNKLPRREQYRQAA